MNTCRPLLADTGDTTRSPASRRRSSSEVIGCAEPAAVRPPARAANRRHTASTAASSAGRGRQASVCQRRARPRDPHAATPALARWRRSRDCQCPGSSRPEVRRPSAATKTGSSPATSVTVPAIEPVIVLPLLAPLDSRLIPYAAANSATLLPRAARLDDSGDPYRVP